MKHCVHEERVAEAARSGEWSGDLLEHRETCLACAEVTLVAGALVDDAEFLTETAAPLPEPRLLWLRARLEKRRSTVERATRLIGLMQRATVVAVIAAVAVLAPRLIALVGGAGRQFVPGLPVTVAAPSVVLVLMISGLGLMALWNELAERG